MIVTIAYFVCVAYLGVPWLPWIAVPTAAIDIFAALSLPYAIHGPREKFKGEDDGGVV